MSYQTIPVNFNLPGAFAEFSNARAQRGLPGLPHKILILGQKLSAGTAEIKKPIAVSQAQADGLFGAKSPLAQMVNAALNANPYQEIYGLAFDEPSTGTVASHNIAIAGTASVASEIVLNVAGVKVTANISKDATATVIATAIKNALDGNASLPIGVTTKSNTSLTVPVAYKGILGNDIDISIASSAPGVNITITQTAGTGTPTSDIIIDALGDTWWTEVVNPFADDSIRDALKDEAKKRDGGTSQKPMMIYSAIAGTKTALETFATTRNSRHESFLSFNEAEKPAFVIASIYGAVIAQNASQSPARPIQYVTLSGAGIITNHSDANRNILLGKGLATLKIAPDGSAQIERAVTTYTANDAGATDNSYRDVEDINNLIYLRYAMNNRLLTYYVRQRIGNDGDKPRNGVVRPKDIKAVLVGLGQEWLDAGLISDIEALQKNLTVTRDTNDSGRVNINLTPELIGQLRQFFSVIEFTL